MITIMSSRVWIGGFVGSGVVIASWVITEVVSSVCWIDGLKSVSRRKILANTKNNSVTFALFNKNWIECLLNSV